MKWTVELTVSFIPCPPEQAPAWRAAMLALNKMATHVKNCECIDAEGEPVPEPALPIQGNVGELSSETQVSTPDGGTG
jgi:hypothetical protein